MAHTDEPRWLSAEEQRIWRAYYSASLLLWDALDQQLQHEAGMPHAHYVILVILSETPGQQLRMTDLAEQMKITRSRLTYAVSRLEKDSLVRREDCPTDKRGQIAVLTDAGAATLAKAAPGHVAAVRAAIFDALSPEQARQLGQACEVMVSVLQADDRVGNIAGLPWRR